MNLADTRTLIERINALDARISLTTSTIDAWAQLLDASARGMPLDFAMREVNAHHSRPDERPIRPADLIQAWRTARQAHGQLPSTPVLDAHCKRGGCRCTHTPPCYRGFNDDNRGQFCKTCNAIRQAAIDDMPSPGQRSQFDFDAFIAKARL
jgi:hypothetical protein